MVESRPLWSLPPSSLREDGGSDHSGLVREDGGSDHNGLVREDGESDHSGLEITRIFLIMPT